MRDCQTGSLRVYTSSAHFKYQGIRVTFTLFRGVEQCPESESPASKAVDHDSLPQGLGTLRMVTRQYLCFAKTSWTVVTFSTNERRQKGAHHFLSLPDCIWFRVYISISTVCVRMHAGFSRLPQSLSIEATKICDLMHDVMIFRCFIHSNLELK